MTELLKLAIQKSGRLSQDSTFLLKECGIKVDVGHTSRRLKVRADNFPLEVMCFRDDDIVSYVADSVAHVGIVGYNVVKESGSDVEILESLGFGKCRLSIAVPKSMEYNKISDLNGLKIATSYPNSLRAFLATHNLECSIHEISGSVEIAPSIGLADAICDLVSSGSTLFSNGLREVATVYQSEAVLIISRTRGDNVAIDKRDEIDDSIDVLRFRLNSVLRAQEYRYVILNAPNSQLENITTLLPGAKSPTVVPLAMSDWSAVHTVVREEKFWEVIEELKKLGAQGILVMQIEKMIL